MKVNGIKFVYRGTNRAGQGFADLLSEMSIEYTEGKKSVSADLAALIVELDKRVIPDQVVAEEASVGMAAPVETPYARAYAWLRSHGFDPHHMGNGDGGVNNPTADNLTMALAKEFFAPEPPTIQTAVPPVHVRDRNVLQWLRAMNIPVGVPITLQFVDDLAAPDEDGLFGDGREI